MHSSSGLPTGRSNMFSFLFSLQQQGCYCTMTFVYKIRYWHIQKWSLEFIVDSSHVESSLTPHPDVLARSKEISFEGFRETGIACFLPRYRVLAKWMAPRFGHVSYINPLRIGLPETHHACWTPEGLTTSKSNSDINPQPSLFFRFFSNSFDRYFR